MARNKKKYNDSDLDTAFIVMRKNLRSYRQAAGLTQGQLAKRTGSSRVAISTISELESGVAGDIRLSTISALARALNREILEFFVNSDLEIKVSDRERLENVAKELQAIVRRLK